MNDGGVKGNESVRTQDRKKKEAEIARLHEKTFRAWANSQLRRRNVKIENSLAQSFHDGLMLITLVEVLSGERCTSKYHKDPEKEIQKIENITIAIEFLKKFIPNVNVSSKDIVDGNLKVILGLVWRLILTFQVEGEGDEDTKGMSAAQRSKAAKLKLLKWCQETTAGHKHVNIQDFESSWYDGMAFCALVHAMDPSLLDYDSLSPENRKHNLSLAFDLAEKHFDIPKLLDPDDILEEDPLSRPDEQCFMTYISAFPVAMLQKKLKRDDEAERRAREEAERRAREEADADAKRKIAEAERKAREEAEAEAARRIAEAERAARKRAEEEARQREADADAKRKAEEEERLRREREAREKEEKQRLKMERRRAKEEEERKRLAELDEQNRLAEMEAHERAFEEERRRLEEENRRLKQSLLDAKAKLIGRIHVTVIQARGLKQKADAYCTLFLERQKERTKTVKKSKEPKWNGEFEFYVSDKDAAIEISVFHRVWLFSDDFLGYVSIPVSELKDGEETEEWYTLKSRKRKDNGPRGELKLKLLYKLEK